MNTDLELPAVALRAGRGLAGLGMLSLGAAVVLSAGVLGMTHASSAQAQTSKRVVLALEPPGSEVTRYWGGRNIWHYLGQSLQMLVDNDPVTGIYSNGAIADRWEHNADFTEWTFHLKQGVQFHFDYGELTSADVLHSYEMSIRPDSLIGSVGLLRGSEVTAPDRYTVKFKLNSPNPSYLYTHAGRGDLYIYSKAQFDREGEEGYDGKFAGTGNYQFVERDPGRILYRRVDNHWSGFTPDFEELEVRLVGEPATRLAMLLAGEAQITILPIELQNQAVARGMEVARSKNPSMQTVMIFNGVYCTTGSAECRPELPWQDIRVREAMNRALNREEMVQVLFEGNAKVLPWFGMHEGNEGYDPTIVERFESRYGYDPERARQLLREAGYPERFANPVIPLIQTAIPGQPELATQAELVQQYFEAVGLQTEIRELDHAAVGAAGRGRAAFFINPIRNAPIRPTDAHLRVVYHPSGSPYEGYQKDEILAFINRLDNTQDAAQRDAIAREAFNYLFDDYAVMPLFEVFTHATYNPRAVSDWTFPGATTSGLSHWHLIKAAP